MASKHHNGWGLTPDTTIYIEQKPTQQPTNKDRSLLERLSEIMDKCYINNYKV